MEITELKRIFKKQLSAARKNKSTLLYFMVRKTMKEHANGARDVHITVHTIPLRDLAGFPENLVPVVETGSQELETPLFEEKADDVDSSN